jgi:hypothetical protein
LYPDAVLFFLSFSMFYSKFFFRDYFRVFSLLDLISLLGFNSCLLITFMFSLIGGGKLRLVCKGASIAKSAIGDIDDGTRMGQQGLVQLED